MFYAVSLFLQWVNEITCVLNLLFFALIYIISRCVPSCSFRKKILNINLFTRSQINNILNSEIRDAATVD